MVISIPLNDINVMSIQIEKDEEDDSLISINDERALQIVDESFDFHTISVVIPFKPNKDVCMIFKGSQLL